MTLRILTYNIEWGFLTLPDDINYDACGHKLPHTKEAQEEHGKRVTASNLISPRLHKERQFASA